MEQNNVERYLASQFYENVNSPKWREKLRGSLGFCREHAWLAVDRRLGDALGYSIIYWDVINSILSALDEKNIVERPSRRPSFLRRIPEQTRPMLEKILYAMTPRKHCPICDYRVETRDDILSALIKGLETPEFINALRASQGLCLPHLRQALEKIPEVAADEKLLLIQREKLDELKVELEEFIRRNDYRNFQSGFGREGDAWLRAIALVVGRKNV